MTEIWGIILAAGESRRLQGGKLLLPYAGVTLIEHVTQQALASDLDQVLLVMGAYSEQMKDLEGLQQAKMCVNEDYREGMLSSVICGLNNLPARVSTAMIIPGDIPGITTGVINSLITACRENDSKIILATCGERRGHPILVDWTLWREVEKLDPGRGLKALMTQFPEEVLEVDTGEPGILRDVDNWEDYFRETNITQ